MVIVLLIMVHFIVLHISGSSGPVTNITNELKTDFHPNYIVKDMLNLSILFLFITLITYLPWVVSDCDNFIEGDPSLTPSHIVPE